jgi:hypothetical protein
VKLRVIVATVEALCRCVSVHRGAVGAAAAATAAARAAAAGEAANAAPPPQMDPAHINADDLLGLLCYVAIHARVPRLHSAVAALGDYAGEDALIERPGFFLTTLQAALMYTTHGDIFLRLGCGHCEAPAAVAAVVCRPCGRRLCAQCNGKLHAAGGGAEGHARVEAPEGGARGAKHSRSDAASSRSAEASVASGAGGAGGGGARRRSASGAARAQGEGASGGAEGRGALPHLATAPARGRSVSAASAVGARAAAAGDSGGSSGGGRAEAEAGAAGAAKAEEEPPRAAGFAEIAAAAAEMVTGASRFQLAEESPEEEEGAE